jgi:hypothetical protein
MSKKINKILGGGCSFTTGTSNYNIACTTPSTWLDFLVSELNFEVFANLAIPGAGNLSTSVNIISFLEKFKKYHFNNKETLVIFNITALDRIDTMCPVEHPDATTCFSYDKVLEYGWITEGSFLTKRPPFNGALQKNIGYDQVRLLNEYAIINLISYLKCNEYDFRFMAMDYKQTLDQSTPTFKSFLKDFDDNFIKFDGLSMYEFCKKQKNLSDDRFHPSTQGYKIISEKILSNLLETKVLK